MESSMVKSDELITPYNISKLGVTKLFSYIGNVLKKRCGSKTEKAAGLLYSPFTRHGSEIVVWFGKFDECLKDKTLRDFGINVTGFVEVEVMKQLVSLYLNGTTERVVDGVSLGDLSSYCSIESGRTLVLKTIQAKNTADHESSGCYKFADSVDLVVKVVVVKPVKAYPVITDSHGNKTIAKPEVVVKTESVLAPSAPVKTWKTVVAPVPTVPVVAQTPTVPTVPVVAQTPTVPTVPVVAQTPTVPTVPVMPPLVRVPTVPVIPVIPSAENQQMLAVILSLPRNVLESLVKNGLDMTTYLR
jgi:hypothetical protein